MYWRNSARVWREIPRRYRWLGKVGKVVSWTEVCKLPVGFGGRGPCIVALVDFGRGRRTVGRLVGVVEGDVKVGMKVEGVLRRLYEDGEDGVIVYGTSFAKVNDFLGFGD